MRQNGAEQRITAMLIFDSKCTSYEISGVPHVVSAKILAFPGGLKFVGYTFPNQPNDLTLGCLTGGRGSVIPVFRPRHMLHRRSPAVCGSVWVFAFPTTSFLSLPLALSEGWV